MLYLPKEYFTPGEKVCSSLEVDPDGNVRMVLTKRLFNFTCDRVRALIGNDFNIEYDKVIAGTRVFSAVKGNFGLSCTKSTRDLEPTYVTVSRRFDKIQSPKDYRSLLEFVKKLKEKSFDAYMEPEGDLDSLNVYKDPQRYGLRNESEAIDALRDSRKKLSFSVIVRFNSKKNSDAEIKSALKELEP